MAIEPHKLEKETTGNVEGTAVKSTYKESFYNKTTGKYEEEEKTSALGEYKGGAVFGFNILAKEKSEFTLYDNAKEEEKKVIFGPIYCKEKESKIIFFPFALPFNNAVFCKVTEGKLVGYVYCDIE